MNSAVSIADVTDGTSNTALMGETLTGTWSEASSCCVRTTARPPDQQADPRSTQWPPADSYYTYWMSKHPGCVNFLQVRRQRLDRHQPDQAAWSSYKIMTRAGGEALSADQIK